MQFTIFANQRFNNFWSDDTVPTWDCVSLRVLKTSQKIPWKDFKKEMNDE